jgi:WhiB family redox-sensing transcriptional regulator
MKTKPDRPKLPVIHPSEWTASALCASYNPVYWDGDTALHTPMAKRICGTCPVSAACLQEALDTEDGVPERYTIRGGLTGKERAELMRRAS